MEPRETLRGRRHVSWSPPSRAGVPINTENLIPTAHRGIQGAVGSLAAGETLLLFLATVRDQFSPSCGLRTQPTPPGSPPGQFASAGIDTWLPRPPLPITLSPRLSCFFVVLFSCLIIGNFMSLKKTL